MAGGGRGRASLNLHRLQDPNARDVLKVIWDQIDMLQGLTNAPVYRGDVNAAGLQHVREPGGVLMKLPIRHMLVLGRVVALP